MATIKGNRARTEKIIEDQGIAALSVVLAEVLSGVLEQRDLHEKIEAVSG